MTGAPIEPVPETEEVILSMETPSTFPKILNDPLPKSIASIISCIPALLLIELAIPVAISILVVIVVTAVKLAVLAVSVVKVTV